MKNRSGNFAVAMWLICCDLLMAGREDGLWRSWGDGLFT